MRWQAPSIVRFLEDAGAHRAAIPTLVAIALASSGGYDSYAFRAGMPGAGDWRGLWAIDIDRHPELRDERLYEPRRAARAAWQLCCTLGTLTWAPAFVTGRHRAFMGQATSAMSLGPFNEADRRPVLSHGYALRAGPAVHTTRGATYGS